MMNYHCKWTHNVSRSIPESFGHFVFVKKYKLKSRSKLGPEILHKVDSEHKIIGCVFFQGLECIFRLLCSFCIIHYLLLRVYFDLLKYIFHSPRNRHKTADHCRHKTADHCQIVSVEYPITRSCKMLRNFMLVQQLTFLLPLLVVSHFRVTLTCRYFPL